MRVVSDKPRPWLKERLRRKIKNDTDGYCPVCNEKLIEIRDHGSYLNWKYCSECQRYRDAEILSEHGKNKKDKIDKIFGEVYLSFARKARSVIT